MTKNDETITLFEVKVYATKLKNIDHKKIKNSSY